MYSELRCEVLLFPCGVFVWDEDKRYWAQNRSALMAQCLTLRQPAAVWKPWGHGPASSSHRSFDDSWHACGISVHASAERGASCTAQKAFFQRDYWPPAVAAGMSHNNRTIRGAGKVNDVAAAWLLCTLNLHFVTAAGRPKPVRWLGTGTGSTIEAVRACGRSHSLPRQKANETLIIISCC